MEERKMKDYVIKEGDYREQGIIRSHKGYQITYAGKQVKSLSLVLYGKNSREIEEEIEMPLAYRKGNLYSAYMEGIDMRNRVYQFRVNGKLVLDPYAKAIVGREHWGQKREASEVYGKYVSESYDWKEDKSPCIPSWQMIMYKIHVRGFTRHKTSKVPHKGTFTGIIEKLPYLKELGITTLELMPAYEFEEVCEREYNYHPTYPIEHPEDNSYLNYWGYGKGNYFTPKYAYGATRNPRKEFKDMVAAIHQQGMEVVMEFCFEPYTSQQLIADCVKYWVEEYHIDGVHLYGEHLPIILLAQEPSLADIKIFQNYQDTRAVYPPEELIESPNLFEYNSGFQSTARKLLKGDGGQISDFAYKNRKNEEQQAVVNYMAGHDGFTLYDSVCYEKKHNEENGESNKDGSNFNDTWNCGVEGATKRKKVLQLRKNQLKNAFSMLFLSQGVPLLLAGDEYCNTQKGNNNPYCQDNEVSWVIWQENAFQREILAFVKKLIAFRKQHPIVSGMVRMRVMDYLACGYPDVSYHSDKAWSACFDGDSRCIGIMYCGNYVCIDRVKNDEFIYVAYNMHWERHTFALPNLPKGQKWVQVADTSKGAEEDWTLEEKQQVLKEQKGVEVSPRSVVILRGKPLKSAKGSRGKNQKRGE